MIVIFTDRTVIVQKGISSINDTIILYRGDKDVEIRFTIVESPFKYRSSVNLIETTDASWGQLVILNSTTSNVIISDIAPTDEGRVVLKITGEMMDEVSEVGDYTFQIRLYDEEKTSRITTPEIVGGITVKEPLAAN